MCSNYQMALGAVGSTPQGLKHLVALDVAVNKKLLNGSGCFKNGGGYFMFNVVCGETETYKGLSSESLHQETTRVILCRLILNDIIIHMNFFNDIIMFNKIV